MPILTSNSKSTEKIYTSDGKPVKTAYDRAGNTVFEATAAVEGVLPLSFAGKGKKAVDYKIYGESVQDGTPTPETPVEVESCGVRTENLFDENSDSVNGYIDNNGNITVNASLPVTTYDHIAVSANTSYTYKSFGTVGGTIRIAFYDSDRNFISRSLAQNGALSYRTVTTPANCAYIRLSIDDAVQKTALYEGGVSGIPGGYVPYGYKVDMVSKQGQNSVTTPVYIGAKPLCKIGNYADYVDYANKRVVRRIKELVLTGKEPFSVSTNYSSKITTTAFAIVPKTSDYSIYSSWVFCNYFGSPTYSVWSKDIEGFMVYGDHYFWFSFSNERLGIADGDSQAVKTQKIKAYLAARYSAGTPIKLYYVLLTPAIEPLSDLNKIPTFEGTTIVDADEDMTVKPSKIYIKYKK